MIVQTEGSSALAASFGVDPSAGPRAVAMIPSRNLLVDPDVSVRRRVPVIIPSSQEYYWTWEWQDGEREALRDLRAGRSRVFNTGADAVRWLLADDD